MFVALQCLCAKVASSLDTVHDLDLGLACYYTALTQVDPGRVKPAAQIVYGSKVQR